MTAPHPIIDAGTLPAPRLELRWRPNDDAEWPLYCAYSLVLPLGEYDIRRENEDGTPVRNEHAVEIGGTRSSGRMERCIRDGHIDTPFRDGAHAKWDRAHLGWPPVYAVAGDKAQLVVPAGYEAETEAA